MGNVHNDGVWILDTADTAKPILGVESVHSIKRILWKPGAGGESCVIKDLDAKIIFDETSIAGSPAGDLEVWSGPGMIPIKGFVLHTLTAGGKLYVYA